MEKKAITCLKRNVWEVQNQEQTQEVKLPDGMPDIGSILGAWGQCVMRSKQWRSDGMDVSGGVMAWVLYAPADGTEPRMLEAWLPVQMKWRFADSHREGSIRTLWFLRNVDARTSSARKIMVRTHVGILGEALEPWETEVYAPDQLPPDVQQLTQTYVAQLPVEAGEHVCTLEESLTLPSGNVAPDQILRFSWDPQITEQNVLGGQAVFHGKGHFHMLYHGVDGQLHHCDWEVPFSRFADLDREYDKEATLAVMMALSSLEPELQEGAVHLKCGLVAQYVVYDRVRVDLVEDAYSPYRSVQIALQDCMLPMVLDRAQERMRCAVTMDHAAGRIVDAAMYLDPPTVRRAGDLTELEVHATIHVLSCEDGGNLQSSTAQWNELWEHPAGADAAVLAQVVPHSALQVTTAAGQIHVGAEIQAEAVTIQQQGIPMVTALECGEKTKPDPARPSLILRRAGDVSLWDIAKKTGSTVDAIQRANGLADEPLDNRLLLIPVS